MPNDPYDPIMLCDDKDASKRARLRVLRHLDGDAPRTNTIMGESYVGTFRTFRDFVSNEVQDYIPGVAEWLIPYFDYDQLARDWILEQSHWILRDENTRGELQGVHVFRNLDHHEKVTGEAVPTDSEL